MTHHDLILAAAVLVALVCLRRRRTGPSDDEMMDAKRASYGRRPDEAKRGGAESAEEDAETARARDGAYQIFNNSHETP